MRTSKKKKEKSVFESIRKPLPQAGGPMTSKKGKRGYDRTKEKIQIKKEIKNDDF